MTKLKHMLPYLIAMIVAFYAMPLLIIDTGSAIFMLLLVIPLYCLIVSCVYGIRQGLGILLPLAVVALCVPAIFIFFNESAWIYCPFYGAIALIGNTLGGLVRMVLKKVRNSAQTTSTPPL